MAYSNSKKASRAPLDTDAQYIAFLKTALRTLLTHEQTQAIISAEYDDFVKGCNANVAGFRPEAKEAFDLCLAEWLLSNRFVPYQGSVQPVAAVYASICTPKLAVHSRSYMESLAGSKLSLYNVLGVSAELTLQDVVHSNRQVQHVQYSPLLPNLSEGEILGLRLFTRSGILCTGFGIYRFVGEIGKKLAQSLTRDCSTYMRQFPGTDADTLDRTVVADRIVQTWVAQVEMIERKI